MIWSGRPGYVPPPILSPHQLTLYSHHDGANPGTIDPPRQVADSQEYDIGDALRLLGVHSDFDLVCVSTGGKHNNKPRNLGQFDCPKVLLGTDTHHGSATPIEDVAGYASREPFDAYVTLYNRDHAKWLSIVGGIPRIGWFPGLNVNEHPVPFNAVRQPHLAFVGNWRKNHPRRKHFLTKLQASDLPLDIRKVPPALSARLYAESAMTFNCSLNGDLNLRVFEVLSAGGCLITDRLGDSSGLGNLLEEDQEILIYDSWRDLRDKVAFYIQRPKTTLEIARRGKHAFSARFSPRIVQQKFLRWAIYGEHPDHDLTPHLQFNGVSTRSRLTVYQHLLRQQLWTERMSILASPQAKNILGDLDAFPRLDRWYVNINGGCAEYHDQSGNIHANDGQERHWSVFVARSSESDLIDQYSARADQTFVV